MFSNQAFVARLPWQLFYLQQHCPKCTIPEINASCVLVIHVKLVLVNFVEHKLDKQLSQKNLDRKNKMAKEKRGGMRERERENNPLTGMNLSL